MGSSRLSAKLVRQGLLARVFRIETDAGTFEISYRGVGLGEWVLVDGVRAGRGGIWHASMVAPHIEFSLGGVPAEIDVRAWPWLGMRAFRLAVAGRVVYSEGRIDDLLVDRLLEGRLSVKLLEQRLDRARAKETDLSRKILRGDPRAPGVSLEATQEETRRLEEQLESARTLVRVRQGGR